MIRFKTKVQYHYSDEKGIDFLNHEPVMLHLMIFMLNGIRMCMYYRLKAKYRNLRGIRRIIMLKKNSKSRR